MSSKDLERPRELYFKYSSNKFQMMRDGVLEEYEQFLVTEEQEKVWLTELIQKELNQLNINNKETLFPLWYILQTNCISTYIENIVDFIEKNSDKADDKRKIISFIGKASDVIDRIDEGCKSRMMLMGKYKRRLDAMRSKYAD